MREVTSHQVNGLNEHLQIQAIDEPGPGGACHIYTIASNEPRNEEDAPRVACWIQFQKGPISPNGVNGISIEALLAIAADRLESFQSGPFACPENQEALSGLEQVMQVLHRRTQDRVTRCVEGTLQV
jgi:hypothetical protein